METQEHEGNTEDKPNKDYTGRSKQRETFGDEGEMRRNKIVAVEPSSLPNHDPCCMQVVLRPNLSVRKGGRRRRRRQQLEANVKQEEVMRM
ncbi:hypothetical protein Pcinc_036025 [Petrolisthes cinctipes]|uniref:Uncharacterized protein n=1 Tax=Petrolisthes cinctipes TaxID=88211 RepID=A0AAE1EPP4_PETCI|nr:hypothetical protein Pcinc_036025 [Petrolisthes cinctipes]